MPDLVPLTRRCTRCGAIGAPPERVGDCRELIHYQVRGTATEEIAGLRAMLATATVSRNQMRQVVEEAEAYIAAVKDNGAFGCAALEAAVERYWEANR